MNKYITKAVLMAGLVTSATLAFGEGIASANVVGYSQSALKKGFSGVGAQFVPVSGDAMDLTDLVPTGYGDICKGSINVQLLDARGRTVAGSEYYWYDTEKYYGWYDEDDTKVEAGQVTYNPGDAVWIAGTSEDQGLQSSGQVPGVGIDVCLRNGFKLVCNPTPVSINFNDDDDNGKFIGVSGYGDVCKGYVNVQKLTERGRTVAGSEFYWFDTAKYYGWYDDDDNYVTGAVLNPGEAIWVKADSEDEKLSFPCVLSN